MKNKVRIGKDFTIRWALLTSEGEPYAINADAAILRIYSQYGVKEAIGFIVSGNVIEWVFKGKDQKHLGDYTIELVENNGRDGMVSVDSEDAFTLVAHTNEESLNDEGAVEIQTIELTSQIALAPVTTGGGGGGSYDDTKIKQDIADLQAKDKATDAELTELSAEVSGLSERIDNLPTAESEVFVAEYGKATYAEIVEAISAGKAVICKCNNTQIGYLVSYSSNNAVFHSYSGVMTWIFTCYDNGTWIFSTSDTRHELKTLDNGNAQITIADKSAEVATPQYVENLLGTIINGDY